HHSRRQFDLRLCKRLLTHPRPERWHDRHQPAHGDWPESSHHVSRYCSEWSESWRAWPGGSPGRGFQERGAVSYCGRHTGEAAQSEADRTRRVEEGTGEVEG